MLRTTASMLGEAKASAWKYNSEGSYKHAFYVPGFGWFGGFPPELAWLIVLDHNRSLLPGIGPEQDPRQLELVFKESSPTQTGGSHA